MSRNHEGVPRRKGSPDWSPCPLHPTRSTAANPDRVEAFLRAYPDEVFALHEIEAALVGLEVNRQLHLDRFVADLPVLVPQFYGKRRIECRVADGIPYFRGAWPRRRSDPYLFPLWR